jgi:hypothetical protein
MANYHYPGFLLNILTYIVQLPFPPSLATGTVATQWLLSTAHAQLLSGTAQLLQQLRQLVVSSACCRGTRSSCPFRVSKLRLRDRCTQTRAHGRQTQRTDTESETERASERRACSTAACSAAASLADAALPTLSFWTSARVACS